MSSNLYSMPWRWLAGLLLMPKDAGDAMPKKAVRRDTGREREQRKSYALQMAELAARLGDRIEQTTFPVYQADMSGRPDAWGSAVLLKLADAPFMLTATHVAERAHDRNLVVATGSALTPVQGEPTHLYREGIQHERDNDIDVTAIRLTHPSWATVEAKSFLTWEELDHLPSEVTRDAFGLHGYPETKQRGSLQGNQLSAFAYQAVAKESPIEWYRAERRDPVTSLMVGFQRRHMWGPEGKLTAPRMHGMSGSGIWRYGPDIWEARERPRLSAIVIECRDKGERQHFLGTRIGPVLAMLLSRYPDLAAFVREKSSIRSR